VYIDNYNNVLGVKTDPSDTLRDLADLAGGPLKGASFSIVIRDQTGNRYVMYPVIFSNFSLRKGERVQVIHGFNEAVHMYAFGKNAEQLSLSGYVLANTLSNFSFLRTKDVLNTPYDKSLRAYSAASIDPTYRATVSGPGGVLVTGVATGLDISMNGAINSVLNFSMNFIAINSLMGVGTSPTAKPTTTTGRFIISKYFPSPLPE